MNINLRRSLVVIFIFVIAIIVSLPAFSFVSAQALISSPTLTLALTKTPAPTIKASSTSTITPTSTVTITPTPTYIAATDIAEIKDLLKKINENTSSDNPYSGFAKRLGEDTAFSTVWKYIAEPLLARILIALASIPLIGKLLLGLRGILKRVGLIKRDDSLQKNQETQVINSKPGAEGESRNISAIKPERKQVNLFGVFIDFANVVILVLVIIMLLPFAFASNTNNTTQSFLTPSVAESVIPATAITISTPLAANTQSNDILGEQTAAERDPINQVASLFFADAMVVGIIVFFVYFASKLAKKQTKIYQVNFSKVNLQKITPHIIQAGLLALILYLLPYPVDAILLPLLIPFVLFSIFDIIQVYPNQYLKSIIVNHYSTIIFLAEFGAWFSFLAAVRNYASPFWEIYRGVWGNIVKGAADHQNSSSASIFNSGMLIDFLWGFAPIFLAIVIAYGPSRHIKEISEKNQIAKIKKSIRKIG